ncbi:MAG: c-type cytochrome [Gammaproteobacteria bacterium]|nr:c-type cytochrome [Gammaproteobacteria bacterium]
MMKASRQILIGLLLSGTIVFSATAAESMAAPDGEKLFAQFCLACHFERGPGTYMLRRRLGDEQALLTARNDLQPAYVKAVVRNGLNGMLRFRKVELPDSQLDAIVDFLGHK